MQVPRFYLLRDVDPRSVRMLKRLAPREGSEHKGDKGE